MIADTTEELRKRGLDWKEDQMELIAWGFERKMKISIFIEAGVKSYTIKEVEALQAMGALITQEADSMCAMSFRMMKADKALWMDLKFYENKGIAEGRKHKI